MPGQNLELAPRLQQAPKVDNVEPASELGERRLQVQAQRSHRGLEQSLEMTVVGHTPRPRKVPVPLRRTQNRVLR